MLRVAAHNYSKRRSQSRSPAMRFSQRHILPQATPRSVATPKLRGAAAIRALILLLIALLLIFVFLMNITGGYYVGGPVLGSILLIGLGAANYAR